MLALDDAFTAAGEQLAGWSETVRGLDSEDFARPASGLPGWDVEALIRHLAEAAWAQAEAFHRARMDIVDQPPLPSITATATELADRIDQARGHLEAAIAAYTGDDWTNVPLPFAVIPAIFAASGIVLEYGVHRYDLDRSLGGDGTLSDATQAAVLGVAAGLLPALGRPAGDEPIAYRLEAATTTVDLIWDGNDWASGDGDSACVVRGDDEGIALLVMGRLGLDHAALRVDDAGGAAARFSELFPGL